MNKVYLVGAGPGDIGLISDKGKKIIRKADVIIHDRLINPDLLKLRKRNSKLIDVGKTPYKKSLKQDEINEIIYNYALENKIVIRLKGGDPYVFGRGQEEAIYLKERNIKTEIVPAVSSVIAGLSYAGIPITSREHSRSFHVISATTKKGEQDFKKYINLDGTIIFVMGVSKLEKIVDAFLEGGKDPLTKIAIIENATLNSQRKIISDLKNIKEKARMEKVKNPSLIVISKNIIFNEELDYFNDKDLYNQKIGVVSYKGRKNKMKQKLLKRGADVTEFELLRIKEEKVKIPHLKDYKGIIFTSKNSVDIFIKNLKDLRGLPKVYAVGKKTAKRLKKHKIIPDFVPEKSNSLELLKLIEDKEAKYIFFRANKAINPFKKKLKNLDEVVLYKTERLKHNKIDIQRLDAFVFTSKSQVEVFFDNYDINIDKIYSIGRTTSEEIIKRGRKVYKESEKQSINKLSKLVRKK